NSSIQSGDFSVLIGNGDGTFAAAVHYGVPSAGGSGFAALGDVDSDGILDVLITVYHSNLVNLYLGYPDGTFAPPTSFAANSVAHTHFDSDYVGAIELGDFNGDGKLDVVTTEAFVGGVPDYDNFVNLSLGNGDGSFQAARRVATSSDSTQLTTGDFNG